MNGLKKQLVKSFINPKVISNKPGELIVQSNAIAKIDKEFQVYDKEGEDLVKLLKGIEEVKIDYETNRIDIKYDINQLNATKVMRWVEIIIDVCIDNLEVIQDNWETDIEYIWKLLRDELTKRLANVRR